MATQGRRRAGDDPNQFEIDWAPAAAVRPPPATPSAPTPPAPRPASPLVQVLPWDFKTSFPEPSDDAIENGTLDESDRLPGNLKSLHDNYARECLATLVALDKVMDARRKGVDPGTGNRPRTHASRVRLDKYLAEEPARLEHTFEVLIETYGDGFGPEAADAFRKAVTAWHAGVEVVAERSVDPAAGPQSASRKTRSPRPSSCLPVPMPLAASVAAGIFGHDEDGKTIRPGAEEVRAITEDQAERMVEMDDNQLQSAVTKYAEDFGGKAAAQLERHVRRRQRRAR